MCCTASVVVKVLLLRYVRNPLILTVTLNQSVTHLDSEIDTAYSLIIASGTSLNLVGQRKTPFLDREKRAGSNAEMSTHVALPWATSSAIALPVAGPFRMPQQECPVHQFYKLRKPC